MGLKIISFFNEGVTWRVAQAADGYYHRELSGMPEWRPGLPSNITQDVVENTFKQLSTTDDSLHPGHLAFKLTYQVGHSNLECFIFSSPEGDPFLVKIPAKTFVSLQEAFPSEVIPRMRVARLVVDQAIQLGLPTLELLPDSPLYDTIHSQMALSFQASAT